MSSEKDPIKKASTELSFAADKARDHAAVNEFRKTLANSLNALSQDKKDEVLKLLKDSGAATADTFDDEQVKAANEIIVIVNDTKSSPPDSDPVAPLAAPARSSGGIKPTSRSLPGKTPKPPSASTSTPAATTPDAKIKFGGIEMTADELKAEREKTLGEIKTLLGEIGRKHVGDAHRTEANGGLPGYTSLYGTLSKIKNLVEDLEKGESVSESEATAIHTEFSNNLATVKEAIKNIKEGTPATPASAYTLDALKTNAETQKSEVLAKIDASPDGAFTPAAENSEDVYALTKEKRKAAIERAYNRFERNLLEVAKLPEAERVAATAKIQELFNEALRLVDPANTEVVDKLSAHEEAVHNHKAAEEAYQAAFKNALAAGKKDIEGLDIDLKTKGQDALMARIEAEEEAFKTMSALRGMEFSQDSVRTGVASRRYLNAARSQKQLENQERIKNAGPVKKVIDKAAKVLSLPLHYGGKLNQYFDNKLKAKIDTKVNTMSPEKLDGKESGAVHDLEIRKAQTAERLFKRNKFVRTWAIKAGVTIVYGAAGAAAGGLAAGGLVAAFTGARVLGGTAGAAAGVGVSNTADYFFRKSKGKNYSSVRESIKAGGATPDKLTADIDKVMKAEQRILTNKKAKGALMFAGALSGGLSAGLAFSDVAELNNGVNQDVYKTPNPHPDSINKTTEGADLAKLQETYNSFEENQMPNEVAESDVQSGDKIPQTEGGAPTPEELKMMDDFIQKCAELEKSIEDLQQQIAAQEQVNNLQEQKIATLTKINASESVTISPEVSAVAVEKLSLDNFKAFESDAGSKITLPRDGDYSLWRIAKGDLVDTSRVPVPIPQPDTFAQVEATQGVEARNQLIAAVVKEIEARPELREALGMKVDNNPNEWLHEGDKFNVAAYERLAKIVAVESGILEASVIEIPSLEVVQGSGPAVNHAAVDVDPNPTRPTARPDSFSNIKTENPSTLESVPPQARPAVEDAVSPAVDANKLPRSQYDTVRNDVLAPETLASGLEEDVADVQRKDIMSDSAKLYQSAGPDDGSRSGQETIDSKPSSVVELQSAVEVPVVSVVDKAPVINNSTDREINFNDVEKPVAPPLDNLSANLKEAADTEKLRYDTETNSFVPVPNEYVEPKNPLTYGVKGKFMFPDNIPEVVNKSAIESTGAATVDKFIAPDTAKVFLGFDNPTQSSINEEVTKRINTYYTDINPPSPENIEELYTIVVMREQLIRTIADSFEKTVEGFEAPEFLKLLSERTSVVLDRVETMPERVQEFIGQLNGQAILKTGYTLLESIEEGIQNKLLELKEGAISITKRGALIDNTKTFEIGPQ